MAAELALVPGAQADADMGVPHERGNAGLLVGLEWKSVRVSHKKEWDKFSRQCLGSKFPVALASHFLRDKQDLFRAWLSNDEDWSKTEVHFERRAEKRHTSHKEREGLKARDIRLKYPDQDKAKTLIDRLTKAGMFYYDPDFPTDPEEIYYYVNQGSKLMTDDITADSTKVKGVDKGNKDLVEALTCEGGVLAVGALPAPVAASEEGQKNLLEAMSGSVGEAPKKKKKDASTPTEPAAPKSFEEILNEKMEECLKKSAEGRRFAVALGSLEYSGDLSKELMTFSNKLEKVFQKMQELRSQGTKDEQVYLKFFQILDDKFKWYQKAEAAAKGLQQGLSAKPKKRAKAKAKSDSKAPDAAAEVK